MWNSSVARRAVNATTDAPADIAPTCMRLNISSYGLHVSNELLLIYLYVAAIAAIFVCASLMLVGHRMGLRVPTEVWLPRSIGMPLVSSTRELFMSIMAENGIDVDPHPPASADAPYVRSDVVSKLKYITLRVEMAFGDAPDDHETQLELTSAYLHVLRRYFRIHHTIMHNCTMQVADCGTRAFQERFDELHLDRVRLQHITERIRTRYQFQYEYTSKRKKSVATWSGRTYNLYRMSVSQ